MTLPQRGSPLSPWSALRNSNEHAELGWNDEDSPSPRPSPPRGRLINASLSVDLPFDRLRANVKGNNPFVLSLSKHDMAYRADL